MKFIGGLTPETMGMSWVLVHETTSEFVKTFMFFSWEYVQRQRQLRDDNPIKGMLITMINQHKVGPPVGWKKTGTPLFSGASLARYSHDLILLVKNSHPNPDVLIKSQSIRFSTCPFKKKHGLPMLVKSACPAKFLCRAMSSFVQARRRILTRSGHRDSRFPGGTWPRQGVHLR